MLLQNCSMLWKYEQIVKQALGGHFSLTYAKYCYGCCISPQKRFA